MEQRMKDIEENIHRLLPIVVGDSFPIPTLEHMEVSVVADMATRNLVYILKTICLGRQIITQLDADDPNVHHHYHICPHMAPVVKGVHMEWINGKRIEVKDYELTSYSMGESSKYAKLMLDEGMLDFLIERLHISRHMVTPDDEPKMKMLLDELYEKHREVMS